MVGKIMGILIEEDASVKPDHLDVPKDSDVFKMDFVREGHQWISSVFDVQYTQVVRIKKMQPEEMWLRYKNWGGFEEHREVLLLKQAITELRARIVSRARPNYFKKSKRSSKAYKTKAGLSKTNDDRESGEPAHD